MECATASPWFCRLPFFILRIVYRLVAYDAHSNGSPKSSGFLVSPISFSSWFLGETSTVYGIPAPPPYAGV